MSSSATLGPYILVANVHTKFPRAHVWSLQVVRVFAFNNGANNGYSTMPIQEPVGVFHEDALQHYDYVVAAAGAIGLRLILSLNNPWCVISPNTINTKTISLRNAAPLASASCLVSTTTGASHHCGTKFAVLPKEV